MSLARWKGFCSPRWRNAASGPRGELMMSTAKSMQASVRPGPTGASAYSTEPAGKCGIRMMSPIPVPP